MAQLLLAANRRYLEFISAIEDDRPSDAAVSSFVRKSFWYTVVPGDTTVSDARGQEVTADRRLVPYLFMVVVLLAVYFAPGKLGLRLAFVM